MATLEYIDYSPKRHFISEDGQVIWCVQPNHTAIKSMPMIYWADGTPWNEVNHWAHARATSGDIKLKTVQDQLRHLHKYANWLELPESPDWRHFPMTRAERVLMKWRKYLIDSRDKYVILAPSTTTARMNACIAFYRYCSVYGFVSRTATKWNDIPLTIKYSDSAGFERSIQTITTDISIKCRVTKRTKVEDGLLPISGKHMMQLLEFAQKNSTPELYLMLKIGFFTGARLQTICDLKIKNIERATQDPEIEGIWRISVGAGSHPYVSTKFDVSGDILVPEQLLGELKAYAYGLRRTTREVKAHANNRGLLFLTSRGNAYQRKEDGKSSSAINNEMVILRRKATSEGLKFMEKFYFHQSRATYGTQLMKLLLAQGDLQAALEFVRNAMFHKEISTTLTYVKFIEQSKGKMQIANAYSQAFLNLAKLKVRKDGL
jgi:integrase